MSEEPNFLTCSCDNCGQNLEFPAEGVGSEVQCPSCGMKTLLYRIASVPVSSVPIPPPVQRASADVSAGKSTERTRASIPPKPPAPSAPALTSEKGKSWVRTVVTVIVTAVVLLAIGLPCIYVWQKRAQETAQVKQKTEQLKTELRLLEAQIQTGLSHNDFLAQVARVRAAHLAARETLNESQEAQYEKLDSCLKACSSFFDEKQSLVDRYPDQEFFEFDDFIEPFAARFGLSKRMGVRVLDSFAGGPKSLGYSFYESFKRLLGDTTGDIEAFLNNQPCPWPI